MRPALFLEISKKNVVKLEPSVPQNTITQHTITKEPNGGLKSKIKGSFNKIRTF